MNSRMTGLFFGTALIIFGVYLFLENFFYFYIDESFFFALFFAATAVFFGWNYAADKRKWWALTLGAFFLWMAWILFASDSRAVDDDTIGVALFWILGLSFLLPFLRNRDLWGLFIPAGACFTLGFVVLMNIWPFYYMYGNEGFVLFLGMAITFGVLFFVRNENRPLGWAAYPAVILFFIALIIGVFDTRSYVGEFIVPVLFIVSGIVLLVRSYLKNTRENGGQLQAQ